MIEEPCREYISGFNLPEKVKERYNLDVGESHRWESWSNVKEENCLSKDGHQINLQERECSICGLIQQRRVRL